MACVVAPLKPRDQIFPSLLLMRIAVIISMALLFLYSRSSSAELDDLQEAAAKGDANAQFELGRRYEDGRGVPKNATAAVEWWTKAATQGHSGAQFGLGVMYATGQGAP